MNLVHGKWSRRARFGAVVAASAVGGAVLMVAVPSLASVPDAAGVIHGCINKATAVVRIIDTAKTGALGQCITTTGPLAETPVTWSQTGPAGVAGAPGTPGTPGQDGAAGPQGPQGATGAQGLQGVAGPVGPQGPEGPAGTACTTACVASPTRSIYLDLGAAFQGESTSVHHPNTIDLQSYAFGVSNSGTTQVGGGGGAGKASFSDISVSKLVDRSGPLLMEAVATGQHIQTATVYVENADGTEITKIVLTDVLASSLQSGGDGVSQSESLSLNFSKIVWTYNVLNPDGTIDLTRSTRGAFDLRTGVKA